MSSQLRGNLLKINSNSRVPVNLAGVLGLGWLIQVPNLVEKLLRQIQSSLWLTFLEICSIQFQKLAINSLETQSIRTLVSLHETFLDQLGCGISGLGTVESMRQHTTD